MSDDVGAALEREAARLVEQQRTCHERVACPRCGAIVGDRCHKKGALYIPRYKGYVPPSPLKHPHVERLRVDGMQLR